MVLECGEIDLAKLLTRHEKARAAQNGTGPDENFLRLYFQQMVEAVRTIHNERIVHSDLKPANFLCVEGEGVTRIQFMYGHPNFRIWRAYGALIPSCPQPLKAP